MKARQDLHQGKNRDSNGSTADSRILRKEILGAYYENNAASSPRKDARRIQKSHPFKSANEDVTITLRLTKEESAVIREYARMCNETIPELFRKVLIREATLADGYGADDLQYEYGVKLPTTASSSHDRQDLEKAYNNIRSILGWKKIKL